MTETAHIYDQLNQEGEQAELEKKLAEAEDTLAQREEFIAELMDEIEELKEEKGLNRSIDPIYVQFEEFHDLSQQPPSNLVDKLITMHRVERAGYMEHINAITELMSARVNAVVKLSQKVPYAQRLVE